jgi:hypothetical protein
MERVIRPQAEGMAEGVVKNLYGAIAPPSAYDQIYGGDQNYQIAKARGELLPQYIAETGKVSPWQVVQNVIFGRPPASPEPKPETPVAQEPPKNQPPSPRGALRAFGIKPRQPEVLGPVGGSSSGDLKRKAFGIRPTSAERLEEMFGRMWD